MIWQEVVLVVAAVLALAVWAVWVQASRLDRLHRKVAASRSALDRQLVRRASAAVELASSGLLDPASALILGDAAWSAATVGGEPDEASLGLEELVPRPGGASPGSPEREQVESELSRTLRTVLDDDEALAGLDAHPVGGPLVEALAAAWFRVHLARRFHNEAVRQTLRVRGKVLVRLLHLAGHAPLPRTVELDDAWPDAFDRRAARRAA